MLLQSGVMLRQYIGTLEEDSAGTVTYLCTLKSRKQDPPKNFAVVSNGI
jgi:hypothetical protein